MKLEDLTTKIYQEGVAKAKEQEEELLGNARKEADRILAEARKKASQIVETAKSEAEQSRARLASELKLAGEQALAQMESRVTECLVDNTLPASVKAGLSDEAFMQQLIREIVEKWNVGDTSVDISVVLPPERREAMKSHFAAKAKDLLDRGLELTYSDEVKTGFQIRPKDGSYRISFREEDFVSFFQGFLRQRTREALFPSRTETVADSNNRQAGQGR